MGTRSRTLGSEEGQWFAGTLFYANPTVNWMMKHFVIFLCSIIRSFRVRMRFFRSRKSATFNRALLSRLSSFAWDIIFGRPLEALTGPITVFLFLRNFLRGEKRKIPPKPRGKAWEKGKIRLPQGRPGIGSGKVKKAGPLSSQREKGGKKVER